MMEKQMERKKVHMGRNVSRFRFAKGLEQKQFAALLKIDQSDLAKLENQPVIDEKELEKMSPLLGVSVELLQTLPDEEMGSLIIQNNTFESGSTAGAGGASVLENNNMPTNNDNSVNNSIEMINELINRIIENEKREREILIKRVGELEEFILEMKGIVKELKK